MPSPLRADVLGVGVSAIDMQQALDGIELAVRARRKGYVCVTGVHGVMEAQSDRCFKAILNGSFLTTPDGMPTVWVGRLQGFRRMDRVYGPDLMLELCRVSEARGYTHFFCGGNEGVARKLARTLRHRFPKLRIVGTFTPPFRPLNPSEQQALRDQVAKAQPDFFWVGMSTPKQERFMASYIDKLDCTVMLGVGAAFDIHAGVTRDAPSWLKKTGLQWCHRLLQEPRRLWKRYLINNPQFICRIMHQFFKQGFSSRQKQKLEA